MGHPPEPAVGPDDAFRKLKARTLIPAMLAGVVVVALALMLATGGPRSGRMLDERLVALMAYVGAGMGVVAVAWHAGLGWRRLFGPAPAREALPLTLVVLPVGVFTLAAALLTYIPLSYVAPRFVERQVLANDRLSNPTSLAQWFALLLLGVVAAPLLEEVVFRGLLMQRWATRWGTTAGVVLSSALFAVLHPEWIGHWVFGVALALLYLRTRTLWIPILAHALNNAIALAGALPSALAHRAEPAETIAGLRGDAVWIAPLLATAALMGWAYRQRYFPDGFAAGLRAPLPYRRSDPGGPAGPG